MNKRSPAGAVVLLLAAAAALWASSVLTWVTVVSADGLGPDRTHSLSGGRWFGALIPCALALLAAVAAVFATRGWLRRVLGVIVALIAAAVSVPPLGLLWAASPPGVRTRAIAELPDRAELKSIAVHNVPLSVAVAGAVLALLAGVLLARRPPAVAGLSGKYDAPATRRARAKKDAAADADGPAPERALWDALDAGTDPTERPPGR